MSKLLIYYHRSYRKISKSRLLFAVQFVIAVIPVTLMILHDYPEITKQMSLIAKDLLAWSFPAGTLEIVQEPFLLDRNVFLLVGPDQYPTTLTALISSLLMLAVILVVQNIKMDKNISIYLTFLALVHMTSSIFFTLTPWSFPYTFTDFAELYVKTMVSIWLFIPFILSMAIVPLPATFIPKLLLIVFTLIYSFVFSTFRYAVFLYVLSKWSFLYMALLFFAFGPLVDFIYIVGIYSVYTTFLAKKLNANQLVWKWLC